MHYAIIVVRWPFSKLYLIYATFRKLALLTSSGLLSLCWIDIGVTTSSPPLSTQTSTGYIVLHQCCLGSFKRSLNLARAKSLQIEALLISIGSTHAEPKVIDACPTKLGSDIMPSFSGCWQQDILLSFTDGHQYPHHWSQLNPQQGPSQALSFSRRDLFCWSDISSWRVGCSPPIKRLNSVLPSRAYHESPRELTATSCS
jgi:hypothetical protein